MLARIAHRGPDGLYAESRGNVALGHARFVLHERERDRRRPVWLPDGSAGLVADARLYNRPELLRALGSPPWFRGVPSDAELLLAAFERWGEESVLRLRGDFAFAVWEAGPLRLFAARDPFGAKPFFYHATPRGIAFGSEPKQLLGLPGVSPEPDAGVIADFLVRGGHRAFERTFFREIRRLPAGHILVAHPRGIAQTRFWPIPPESFRGSPHACAEAFSELFPQSLRLRLAIDARAAIHLSGGYDSSAIAVAAAAIAPPLTASLLYPGFGCDESLYSRAVAAACGGEHLEAVAPFRDFTAGIPAEMRKVDAPLPEIRWQEWAALAPPIRERGAKVILTGLGGDEVAAEPDYAADLCRSRRYLSALRYWRRDPRAPRAERPLRLLLRCSVPAGLKRLLRRGVPAPLPPLPDWVDPAFAGAHREAIARPSFTGPTFPDQARETVARRVTDPSALGILELAEAAGSYDGFESRHPFYDQDLVDFVLSIPFATRFRFPPAFKTLLRSALGDRIPSVVRERSSKTRFDSYVLALFARGWPSLRGRLAAPDRLAAAPYLLPERIASVWSRPLSPEMPWFTTARPYWQPAFLELWLRSLPSRSAPPGSSGKG